jgi:hypothetical protein
MNRQTMTHYRGICKNIATFSDMKKKEIQQRNYLQKIQPSEIQTTVLQPVTEKESVIQKTQLHFQYNNNTKCLEIVNAVADFFENPGAYNNKKKMQNDVEITIQIKKIEFSN